MRDESKSKKTKFTVKQWAAVLGIALLGAWLPQHFNVTMTPSNSYRVFWATGKPPVSGALKGKFILFDEPKNPYLPEPRTTNVTKMVVCDAGDELAVQGDRFFCNGRLIGIGKHYTLKGLPVKLFVFNGVIPDDSLFVMGDHKDSFDSRYFGFIKRSCVKAIEHPLI